MDPPRALGGPRLVSPTTATSEAIGSRSSSSRSREMPEVEQVEGRGERSESTGQVESFRQAVNKFLGPAVVVETAEAPRFNVTWDSDEEDRLFVLARLMAAS